MGRKIKPDLLRLGIHMPWASRWFYTKTSQALLQEDMMIRDTIQKRLRHAGIASITIERTRGDIRVSIKSNRPGLIIGREGKGIEELRKTIHKQIVDLRKKNGRDPSFGLHLNVVEMRRTELSAAVIAGQVASDLERRVPFRTVLKRHIRLIQQNREVKGVKIRVSGRLNGAEIARSESLSRGSMPLQTLRADIDYGEATAYTTYGTIGVKVWLYKGEVFEQGIRQDI